MKDVIRHTHTFDIHTVYSLCKRKAEAVVMA